jgi:hypothetical protein
LFVPDVPPALDQSRRCSWPNARLRQVIEAKDTEIRVLPEPVEAVGSRG